MIGRAALALAVLCGCNGEGPSQAPPQRRSDAVVATPTATSARPSATPSNARRSGPPPCSGQSLRDPPGKLENARAASGARAPAALRYGDRWLWINVWAAWCGPCKEEMPLLFAWRDRLKDEGVNIELAFVSIDDDERELTRFLEAQPARGVRASYWLEEEEARADWFESAGFVRTPILPVHALVSPGGKLACTIHGQVEQADYGAISGLLGRR